MRLEELLFCFVRAPPLSIGEAKFVMGLVERRTRDPERVECLEDVGHVRCDRPRRFPVRPAVPAQIRREDAEARGEPLLREPLEASSMCSDAVERDEGRRVAIAPFVHVQSHPTAPLAVPSSGRTGCARASV